MVPRYFKFPFQLRGILYVAHLNRLHLAYDLQVGLRLVLRQRRLTTVAYFALVQLKGRLLGRLDYLRWVDCPRPFAEQNILIALQLHFARLTLLHLRLRLLLFNCSSLLLRYAFDRLRFLGGHFRNSLGTWLLRSDCLLARIVALLLVLVLRFGL